MTRLRGFRSARNVLLVLLAATVLGAGGCSTAPKAKDQASFKSEARAAEMWFERNVAGLDDQIANSAGYIIFPSVGQYGIIIGGGKFGRGLLCDSNGRQLGWGAINTGSIGLQAGVQGFKMLVVLQDKQAMDRFMYDKLSGSVSAVAVAAEAGGSGLASFENGAAVYQGANTGLMAGVNIGLDYIRYQPLDK